MVVSFTLLCSRMADIVGEQGEKVETIHQATETSHAAAEAGLEQIKKDK